MSKRNIVYFSGLLFFIIFLIIHREIAIITGLLMIFIIGLMVEKGKNWAWIPAIGISWGWVILIKDIYSDYSLFGVKIFGISIFPIIAWPTLLMLGYYVIYPKLQGKNNWINFFKMAIVWTVLLVIFESIGYNLLGIHLTYGKQFHGWPILNCFHAPWWMQLGYFVNGWIFYLIISHKNFFEKTLKKTLDF